MPGNEILGWTPTGLAGKGIKIGRPDSNLHAEPEPTPQDGYGKTGKHFGLGSQLGTIVSDGICRSDNRKLPPANEEALRTHLQHRRL